MNDSLIFLCRRNTTTPIFDAIALFALFLALVSFLTLITLASLYPAPTVVHAAVFVPLDLRPVVTAPSFVSPLQLWCSGYLASVIGLWWWHVVCVTCLGGQARVIATLRSFTYSATGWGILVMTSVSIFVMTLGGMAFVGPVLGRPDPMTVYGAAVGAALTGEFIIPYVKMLRRSKMPTHGV